MFLRDVRWGAACLRRSVWNPEHFALLLLHDGDDLSANVGDASSLDNACNKEKHLILTEHLFSLSF